MSDFSAEEFIDQKVLLYSVSHPTTMSFTMESELPHTEPATNQTSIQGYFKSTPISDIDRIVAK